MEIYVCGYPWPISSFHTIHFTVKVVCFLCLGLIAKFFLSLLLSLTILSPNLWPVSTACELCKTQFTIYNLIKFQFELNLKKNQTPYLCNTFLMFIFLLSLLQVCEKPDIAFPNTIQQLKLSIRVGMRQPNCDNDWKLMLKMMLIQFARLCLSKFFNFL